MELLRFLLFGRTQIIYTVLAVFRFKVVRNSHGFPLKHREIKKCSLEDRLCKSFFTTA